MIILSDQARMSFVIDILLPCGREIHIPVNFPVFAKKSIFANFEVIFLKVLTLASDGKLAVHRVSDLISSLAVLEFEFKASHLYNMRFPAARY